LKTSVKEPAVSSRASSVAGASALGKRKAPSPSSEVDPKSSKTSRESTPAQGRSTRTRKKVVNYNKDTDDSDLDDDEFERRLVEQEAVKQIEELEAMQKSDDFHLAQSYELARKFSLAHSTLLPKCHPRLF